MVFTNLFPLSLVEPRKKHKTKLAISQIFAKKLQFLLMSKHTSTLAGYRSFPESISPRFSSDDYIYLYPSKMSLHIPVIYTPNCFILYFLVHSYIIWFLWALRDSFGCTSMSLSRIDKSVGCTFESLMVLFSVT